MAAFAFDLDQFLAMSESHRGYCLGRVAFGTDDHCLIALYKGFTGLLICHALLYSSLILTMGRYQQRDFAPRL
jgi:hypothetical protein